MKNKLISSLVFVCVLIRFGAIDLSAAKNETSGGSGTLHKTVPINSAPTKQSSNSDMYNFIMQNQQKMNKKMSKMMDDPFFVSSHKIPSSSFGAGMGLAKTNFIEKTNEYTLEIGMPGIDKKNIEIGLVGHMLTVSTKKSNSLSKISNNNQSYQQISNAFTRSFSIPPNVDSSKITSNYKNDVLTIDFPKNSSNSTNKKINISVN